MESLFEISDIISRKIVDGEEVPCEGELYYRGYDVKKIVDGFISDNRFGFEEVVYLLLFGDLPNSAELKEFKELLSENIENYIHDIKELD